MLSLLLVIACFPHFITSSNLALTFDAANSTCTAACSTCSDTVNQGLLLLLLLSLERLLSYYVMWLGLVTEHTF